MTEKDTVDDKLNFTELGSTLNKASQSFFLYEWNLPKYKTCLPFKHKSI